jgi:hypothetical protein
MVKATHVRREAAVLARVVESETCAQTVVIKGASEPYAVAVEQHPIVSQHVDREDVLRLLRDRYAIARRVDCRDGAALGEIPEDDQLVS